MIKQIFLDMDGVLDDFDKQANSLNIFYFNNNGERKCKWNLINAIGPKFWSDMEPFTDGLIMYQSLLKLCQEYNISLKILSAGPGECCYNGKLDWLHKFCPEISDDNIIIKRKGIDKAEEANSESILIDDTEKNIIAFNNAGGHGFLYNHNPNEAIQFCTSLLNI